LVGILKAGTGMVENESREVIKFPPHCALLEDLSQVEEGGWREALISGGDHLKRVLDEYVELDFECLLEELDSPNVEGCTECFKVEGERIFRVYVRSRDR
jgi:hypothetical protein